MSDSMFQKDINDEISIRDLDLPNPAPDRLDSRHDIDKQIFSAKPGWVVKSVYSSADSLSAFTDDDEVNVFVSYSRQSNGKDALFLQQTISADSDALVVLTFDALPEEAKGYVGADFRS